MNIESYLVKYSGPNRDKLTPAELVFDGKLPMGARQAVAQAAGAAAGAAASAVKSGFRGHREGRGAASTDRVERSGFMSGAEPPVFYPGFEAGGESVYRAQANTSGFRGGREGLNPNQLNPYGS